MQLQENLLFADRYQLVRLLGRGGFSEVWLAKDPLTGLELAIKVYSPGYGMDDDGLKEFAAELANVYNLNHTNLLKPQHVDSWERMPYLIIPFCENGSCAKRLGTFTEDEMWQFIRDVAAGLEYLHGRDIIHQDIKPDNILVGSDGHYLITDFGISTQVRSTLRKSMQISSSSGAGTTAYMGPERFSAHPLAVKASDIWSFGAMCYELLEGVVPFGEIGGGMQKAGADMPDFRSPVSDRLRNVITRMLSKETWDRPTAAKILEWATSTQSVEPVAAADLTKDAGKQPETKAASPASEPSSKAPKVSPLPAEEPKKTRVWVWVGAVIAILAVIILVANRCSDGASPTSQPAVKTAVSAKPSASAASESSAPAQQKSASSASQAAAPASSKPSSAAPTTTSSEGAEALRLAQKALREHRYDDADKYARKAKNLGEKGASQVITDLRNLGYYD